MKSLIQKRRFVTRAFEIREGKLSYTVSWFGDLEEKIIQFEMIAGDVINRKTSNHALLLGTLICGLLTLILFIVRLSGGNMGNAGEFVWLIIGAILFLAYYFQRIDSWRIKTTDEGHIDINKNLPDKESVNNFIAALLESRRDYLKRSYAIVDPNLGYEDQLKNLKWLKAMGALTYEEYEEKYKLLRTVVAPDKPSIGF